MIKFIIIFLTASSILFAGDSFMEFWKAYDYGMLLSIMFLIIIIPIWMIVSLFTKNKSNRLFKSLILIDLAIFIISIISSSINQHIEAQNYKPSHKFQKPYTYGIYKNSTIAIEEKNDSIVDIHIDDSYPREPSYLTKKGLLVCDESYSNKIHHRYINTEHIYPLMAKCSDLRLIFLSEMKEILYFDINTSKFRHKQNEPILNIPNSLNLDKDYIENAHHKKYGKKGDRSYWSDYEELYLDHVEINDTKSIEKIGYHKLLPVMDKEKNEIILHNNGIPIHKFQVDNRPKLVTYDRNKDIFYIVYENDDAKIYELKNKLSKTYVAVQNNVKSIIDSAFRPWWKFINVPMKGVSKKDIQKIENFYDNNKHISFYYKVLQNKNSIYHIEVTTDYKPFTSMYFTIEHTNENTQLLSLEFIKRKFMPKELTTLAETFSMAKDDYDILIGLTKLEALIKDTVYEQVDKRSPLKKGFIKQTINKQMRTYFYSNEEVLRHNLKDKITLFKTKYPCIVSYLSKLRKNGGLNEPHPLTNEYIRKTLSGLFWFLNNKCNLNNETNLNNYKSLFKKIDKKYPLTNNYTLKKLLRKFKINSLRLKDKKFPKKTIQRKKTTLLEYKTMEEKRIQNLKKLTGSYKKQYKKSLQSSTHPIFATIKFHQNKKFIELLSTMNNLEIKDSLGYTPFFVATNQKNTFAMKALSKQGAHINILDKHKLYTPLTWMVYSDRNIEVVKLLLKLGADINYQYEKSETALTVAAKGCKNLHMVKLLLASGANKYLENRYGFNTITGLARYCPNKDDYNKMFKLINNSQ